MKTAKATPLIPFEHLVRKLDHKLLLARIANRRGFSVVIGSNRDIDYQIFSLPWRTFLSKIFTRGNPRTAI